MPNHTYLVIVSCESKAIADRVMLERLGVDDTFDADYELQWSDA